MKAPGAFGKRAACAPDPETSARQGGLRYVSDQSPGITRSGPARHFIYHDSKGRPIRDRQVLARIRSLAIPPAWKEVWICPHPEGHLQAVGRDARGRKQYRYHPRWREVRDETKYHRMIGFAHALPGIRRMVRRDLRRPGLPREKVLAAVVRLLEISHIRVGNEEYAQQNKSYGLTTLQDRHVSVKGAQIAFRFRGKSGKEHQVTLENARLARVVQKCQDIPGQDLFQYLDENGTRCDVTSGDVNNYLKEISATDFTAKDFRTWAGTLLLLELLLSLPRPETKGAAKKQVVQCVKEVATCLGNTPSVCRKCYIHPSVVAAYEEQTFWNYFGSRNGQPTAELLVKFLQRRCREEADPKRLEKQLAASLRKAVRHSQRSL